MRTLLLLSLSVAACTANPSQQSAALVASADVQTTFGISAYQVDDASVTLLDEAGDVVGDLSVTAPTVETRQVVIRIRDNEWINDVTRPIAGRFEAPAGRARESTLQADPALAAFFERYDLKFTVTAAAGRPSLAPSDLVSCADIPFTAQCTPTDCYGGTDYYGTAYKTSGWDCASDCSPYYGEATSCNYLGWCECNCNARYTTLKRHANCPTANGCGSGIDVVAKERDCAEPGSCSNFALGFQYCG